MRRVLALLAFAVAAVAAVPTNPQKIVGGSVTTIENYPSIANVLRTYDGSTYWQDCGGSIINTRAILTAAHCVVGDTPATWRIRVGSTWANSGGVVHNVQSVTIHANYDSRSGRDFDIAIVRLSSTIAYNNNVRAGNYAGASYNLGDNQVVWIAGWGSIYSGGPTSEQLQHVQVWSVNQAVCNQLYATIGNTITDNMLCAGYLNVGGRDACQGDSGGPLYHNNNIVGVTSWGFGCAEANYPGVYVRVSSFITWIQANA